MSSDQPIDNGPPPALPTKKKPHLTSHASSTVAPTASNVAASTIAHAAASTTTVAAAAAAAAVPSVDAATVSTATVATASTATAVATSAPTNTGADTVAKSSEDAAVVVATADNVVELSDEKDIHIRIKVPSVIGDDASRSSSAVSSSSTSSAAPSSLLVADSDQLEFLDDASLSTPHTRARSDRVDARAEDADHVIVKLQSQRASLINADLESKHDGAAEDILDPIVSSSSFSSTSTSASAASFDDEYQPPVRGLASASGEDVELHPSTVAALGCLRAGVGTHSRNISGGALSAGGAVQGGLSSRRGSLSIQVAADIASAVPHTHVADTPSHPRSATNASHLQHVVGGDLFSPTHPSDTPLPVFDEMNVFSPTRPTFTPSVSPFVVPSPKSAGIPLGATTTVTMTPIRPPRPTKVQLSTQTRSAASSPVRSPEPSPSNKTASSGSASKASAPASASPSSPPASALALPLTFLSSARHQFAALDAQVGAGQAVVRRVATFLRRACEAAETHAVAMLKLASSAQAAAADEKAHDAMQDTTLVVANLSVAIESVAQRDRTMATGTLERVVRPLLAWLPQAEDRRSRISKDEKSSTSITTRMNLDVEKLRATCTKSYAEVLTAKRDREAVMAAGPGPPPSGMSQLEKKLQSATSKLLKAKDSARKEFVKFESMQLATDARNSEHRTVMITVMIEVEALERERLVMLKHAVAEFAALLRESVGGGLSETALPILRIIEEQIATLSIDGDVHRFLTASLLSHGQPPADQPPVQNLPCTSESLEPEEPTASASSRESSRRATIMVSPSKSFNEPHSDESISEESAHRLAQSEVMSSIVSASGSPKHAASGSGSGAAGAAEDADDDEEDGEDDAVACMLPQSVVEDWYVARIDYPAKVDAPPSSSSSTPSSTSTSSALPSSSSFSSSSTTSLLPFLRFAADDIIRVLDKPSSSGGCDNFWIGQNVSDLSGSVGRFPSPTVASVEENQVESYLPSGPEIAFADVLRTKVSKKKRRFRADGFDLDLSYVLPNCIAMGYPSEGFEGTYRNHMSDVQQFFIKRHTNNYKLYNLCSERHYDPAKFDGRVARFPFDDHNPCALANILPIMADIHAHIHPNGVLDPARVVAIHCKAGKGRTGFIICCWLMYAGLFPTYAPELALRFYSIKRTKNGKGVTIPSQIRYVMYFARWLRAERGIDATSLLPSSILPVRRPVLLQSVRIIGIPEGARGNARELHFKITQAEGRPYMSRGYVVCDRKTNEDIATFTPSPSIVAPSSTSASQTGIVYLDHDAKMSFYVGGQFTSKLFCECWFNTRMIGMMGENYDSKESDSSSSSPRTLRLVLLKGQLDKANKDVHHRNTPDTFRIEMTFTSSV